MTSCCTALAATTRNVACVLLDTELTTSRFDDMTIHARIHTRSKPRRCQLTVFPVFCLVCMFQGPGLLLNQALIAYACAFLRKMEYTMMQPPFFMKQSVMGAVAQLEDFDDALYKVCVSVYVLPCGSALRHTPQGYSHTAGGVMTLVAGHWRRR